MTVIVLGPKSRLGREIITQLGRDDVVALARSATDVAEVERITGLPAAAVIDGSTARFAEFLNADSSPLRLVIATLGPIHAETPLFSADAEAAIRDFGFVSQVVESGRPLSIIVVSTVIAFAPGEDRRYYGGWKALVEQQIQQLIDARSSHEAPVSLSVFYPGRLVDRSERKGKLLVHATYQQLAESILGSTPATGRVIGIDARLWLCVASLKLALQALFASKSRVSSRGISA